MKTLDMCLAQSHPRQAEILRGVAESGLKATYAPCVLIIQKSFNDARAIILKMNGLDQRRAFQLFIAIFAIADTRRRSEECLNGCTHEWHNIV